MNSRVASFVALTLGALAALGTLTSAYGLVYPSGSHDTKQPLAWAIFAGALLAQLGLVIGFRSYRGARSESERFFALLALASAAFMLFLVVFGFGIPALVLGVHD
jgi:hypothetical protein